MGKRRTAIWCVLFALLANVANGSGPSVVPSHEAGAGGVSVCDAQTLIADLDTAPDHARAEDGTVCDLQRTLGNAAGDEEPAHAPQPDRVVAVLQSYRSATGPLNDSTSTALNGPNLHDLGRVAAPSASVFASPPPDRAPGNRYLFLLTPHAPPASV